MKEAEMFPTGETQIFFHLPYFTAHVTTEMIAMKVGSLQSSVINLGKCT